LTNLEQLTLNRNPGIKGSGLRHLKEMNQLRLLELLSAKSGDRQLHHLAVLPNLETLDLQYTQLTDNGLQQLKDFPKLTVVRIFRSKVTKRGVERLHKAAPGIKVIQQPFWLEQLDGGPPKQVEHDAAGGIVPVRVDPESDFPGYLGPKRNGIVQGPAISTDWDASPPKELWRMPIGGGFSSFAVVGDHAVTAEQRGPQEAIVCYDVRTGQQLWIYRYKAFFSDEWGGEGPRATPTIFDDKVYNLGALGQLVCLDLATGSEKWTTNILTNKQGKEVTNVLWGMSGSPLVVGDRVIVNPGSEKGDGIAAYDRMTGKLVWRAPTLLGFNKNMAGYSSPMSATIDGMKQIVIFSGAGLSGHDPASGARLWNFKWPQSMGTNIAQPLLLEGDRILISTGYGIGSALVQIRRDQTGWSAEQIWKSKGMKCKHTSPVLHGDYVYGLDEGILACISIEDGEQQWKRGRFGHGQILLTGDVIVVLSDKGKLALVNANPDGFELLGQIQALPETRTWNPPALFGGRLLIRNEIEVVCYDLRED
ncbi:MAG: PQQ-binding-like beta-propeller repeat protein, partial [Planctomycetales bacterium]